MDRTFITYDVIKENVPGGQNRYDSWLHKEKGGLGLGERAGRLKNKGRSDVARKYRILCILKYRPFGKGKCN